MPAVNETLPEFPVPGEVTVAVAPAGVFDTLAVNEAMEAVRVIVIPTVAAASFGKVATVELPSCKENGAGTGSLC